MEFFPFCSFILFERKSQMSKQSNAVPLTVHGNPSSALHSPMTPGARALSVSPGTPVTPPSPPSTRQPSTPSTEGQSPTTSLDAANQKWTPTPPLTPVTGRHSSNSPQHPSFGEADSTPRQSTSSSSKGVSEPTASPHHLSSPQPRDPRTEKAEDCSAESAVDPSMSMSVSSETASWVSCTSTGRPPSTCGSQEITFEQWERWVKEAASASPTDLQPDHMKFRMEEEGAPSRSVRFDMGPHRPASATSCIVRIESPKQHPHQDDIVAASPHAVMVGSVIVTDPQRLRVRSPDSTTPKANSAQRNSNPASLWNQAIRSFFWLLFTLLVLCFVLNIVTNRMPDPETNPQLPDLAFDFVFTKKMEIGHYTDFCIMGGLLLVSLLLCRICYEQYAAVAFLEDQGHIVIGGNSLDGAAPVVVTGGDQEAAAENNRRILSKFSSSRKSLSRKIRSKVQRYLDLGSAVFGTKYEFVDPKLRASIPFAHVFDEERWNEGAALVIRFCVAYGLSTIGRTISILLTSLPTPNNGCHDHVPEIHSYFVNTLLGFVTFGGGNKHCGDLLYSGHTILIVMNFLTLWKFAFNNKRFSIYPSPPAAGTGATGDTATSSEEDKWGTLVIKTILGVTVPLIGAMLLLLSWFTILASRSHYSDDVFFAVYCTASLFFLLEFHGRTIKQSTTPQHGADVVHHHHQKKHVEKFMVPLLFPLTPRRSMMVE